MGDILRLLGPRTAGAAVYQGSVVVHTALASFSAIVGEGAVAVLYFANRLVQLPLALVGTAAAQASLPSLAEQAAKDDLPAFRTTLLTVLRMVGFSVLPASMGLIVLARPIVHGLFERGAFDASATLATSQALACYAVGLLAYAVSKVLTGAFYALHDTRTPVRLSIEAMVVNVALSVALMWPLKVNGLALAAAVANSLNAVRLARCLEARLGTPLLTALRGPLLRQLAASLLMGAACWWVSRQGVAALPPWGELSLLILTGLVGYAVSCRFVGVRELSSVLRWFSHSRPFASK